MLKNTLRCVINVKEEINKYVKYATLHFDVATFPMQFISMDLIGEFHPLTSRKHRYALTVICMLTGYVFCVPLKTKAAEESHTSLYRQCVFQIWRVIENVE